MPPPSALMPLAPIKGHATRDVQLLAGTASDASTALAVGRFATAVFEVDVRLAFGATAQTAVETTDLYWPAKIPFSWTVEAETQFISAIHNDGSTQFDGAVWQSSR